MHSPGGTAVVVVVVVVGVACPLPPKRNNRKNNTKIKPPITPNRVLFFDVMVLAPFESKGTLENVF